MGLKVRLHRRARSDLASIRDYLLQHAGPAAAERVRRHLLARMMRLGDFPATGIATDEPGVRVLSPTKYPYRIYFAVTETTVVILHVRHTARRVPEPGELS